MTVTNPGEGGGKICHFYSKFIVIFGYQKKSKREEKEKNLKKGFPLGNSLVTLYIYHIGTKGVTLSLNLWW